MLRVAAWQPKFGLLTERDTIRDWGSIMSPPAPNTTYSSFNSTSAVVRPSLSVATEFIIFARP
eukprot:COSAG04_NODE_6271_length_1368_cov_1.991332_1_plen_63_part_00